MDWLTFADQVVRYFPGTLVIEMKKPENEYVDKHIKSEDVPVEPLEILDVVSDVLASDQGSEG